MALVNCRECGKEVSSSATKCPHCGIRTPNEEHKKIANRILIIFALLFLLPVLMIIFATSSVDDALPLGDQASEASKEFVKNNTYLGELAFPYIEATSDWAQGKRKWVTTDKGTFLFYLKGNEVVTVYLSDKNADGGRHEIWRKP